MLWKFNFVAIWVSSLITEFWAEDKKYKHFTEVGTLDVQEQHLALEILTSRTAHSERERERAHLQNNIKEKHEQLKLSKTYLSMWP
jgi:hypothetical protein